jgi:hypothetical protein
MPNWELISLLGAAGAGGGGLFYGAKALWKTQRTLAQATLSEQPERTTQGGRIRQSNCLALLEDGAVRHIDGGYIRGYEVAMAQSLFDEPELVEDLYDNLGRLLALEKPPGTLLQWRLSHHHDVGFALTEHKASQALPEETYGPARLFHDYQLDYYERLAAEASFRRLRLTLWVYVPVKNGNDNLQNGLGAGIRQLRKEKFNFANLREAVSLSQEKVIRRLAEAEREAYEEADKVMRLLEQASPLRLERLSREATWQGLYFGHNERAFTCPPPPQEITTDLRPYLCQESISGNESWYVLHGSTPVTIVSLFVPPDPGSQAGMMRALTNNPTLLSRHTIVTEFIYLDKEKARKELRRRKSKIEKTSVRSSGGRKLSEEQARALTELSQVQEELTSAGKALTQARFYVLVYGNPAQTQKELQESLRELEKNCEALITTIRNAMPGADAAREEPAALQALYEGTLLGEMNPRRRTGREHQELTESLAPLIGAESPWRGMKNPHSLVATVGGTCIGLNFFQNKYSTSPLVMVIANSGGGKSVFMARCASDALASLPYAKVRAVDFGESLGPLVDVIGGRHLRFVKGEVRAINIFDYKGLEEGIAPDDEQITLVVEDALLLTRTDAASERGKIREAVLRKCVMEVMADEIPHNGAGRQRHEPTLSHLITKLRHYPFSPNIAEQAQELALLLEEYQNHPWLDAPTDPSYREESPFDVYELDSLDKFPRDVAACLAFRVAARVLRTMGEKRDGELTPTLLIFDELKRIKDRYPVIMTALKKAARQGRKENVVTMLGTQAYEDLEDLRDVTANAGAAIIGKQIGNIDQLVNDLGWSVMGRLAVQSISNVKGSHAQFVVSFGSGADQQVEMIQVDLAPVELWTFTSEPVERNARARVARLMPEWSTPEIVLWLARNYPRGLFYENLAGIDEKLLPARETPLEPLLALNPAPQAVEEFDTVNFEEEEILAMFAESFQEDESEAEKQRRRRQLLEDALGVSLEGFVVNEADAEAIEAEYSVIER